MFLPVENENRIAVFPVKDLKKGDVVRYALKTKDGAMTVNATVKKVFIHPSNPDRVRVTMVVPAYKMFREIVFRNDFRNEESVELVVDGAK